MIQNSFAQKVILTIFFGFCAAGVLQFYIKMVWQANEDINGTKALEIYKDAKQVAHPARPGSITN